MSRYRKRQHVNEKFPLISFKRQAASLTKFSYQHKSFGARSTHRSVNFSHYSPSKPIYCWATNCKEFSFTQFQKKRETKEKSVLEISIHTSFSHSPKYSKITYFVLECGYSGIFFFFFCNHFTYTQWDRQNLVNLQIPSRWTVELRNWNRRTRGNYYFFIQMIPVRMSDSLVFHRDELSDSDAVSRSTEHFGTTTRTMQTDAT